MAGMRDKLIHDYFGMNLMVVWKTVSEDLSWRPLFDAFWTIRIFKTREWFTLILFCSFVFWRAFR
ncbi:MAG: DUF86 domain-containing protein [Syntrophobacteraceae bacterium]